MELTNLQSLHSSEKTEILLGESGGTKYILKRNALADDVYEELKRVNSPYAARVPENSADFHIMEYADGKPLNAAEIRPAQIYEIACEICDGLTALHERGIIHRDIKPSNIMLCGEHIKIIDFDAARIKKPTADKDTKFIGTDGFASPEQYGFMQTDERTDIHALGVTLKLLLGEDYAKSRYKPVIEKCSRFNPEERYSSAKAVKSTLFRAWFTPFLGAAAAVLLVFAVGITMRSLIEHPWDYNNLPNGVNNVSKQISTDNSSTTSVSTGVNTEISTEISSNIDFSTENNSRTPLVSNHTFMWEILVLPLGFPKLRDTVNYFETVNGSEKEYRLSWNEMSDKDAEDMLSLIREWLGTVDEESNAEYIDGKNWTVANSEFKIVLSRLYLKPQDDYWEGVLQIYPLKDKITANYKKDVPQTVGNRPISWDSLDLPYEFPQLATSVSGFKVEKKEGRTIFSFSWDKMSSEEVCAVVARLSEMFDECKQMCLLGIIEWGFDYTEKADYRARASVRYNSDADVAEYGCPKTEIGIDCYYYSTAS